MRVRYVGDDPVGPHQDAPPWAAGQGQQGRGPAGAHGLDVDPAAICLPAQGVSAGAGWGREADVDEEEALGAAQVHEAGIRPSRCQHRGSSLQDLVQPDRRPVTSGHERVGDQAARSAW